MTQERFRPTTKQPTGGVHPVKRFRGRQTKWADEAVTYDKDKPSERTVHNIHFYYRDCDIKELMGKDAYAFKTVDFIIQWADYTRRGAEETRWEAFASSLRSLYGRDVDLDELNGIEVEWAQLPFKIRQPMLNQDGSPMMDRNGNQVFAAQETPCWQVVWTENAGGSGGAGPQTSEDRDKALYQYLASQASGKTAQEFYIGLVGDQKVTDRSDIIDMITEENLIDFLKSMNLVQEDPDGRLVSTGG